MTDGDEERDEVLERIEGVYDQPEQLVRGAHRRNLLGKLEADPTKTNQ